MNRTTKKRNEALAAMAARIGELPTSILASTEETSTPVSPAAQRTARTLVAGMTSPARVRRLARLLDELVEVDHAGQPRPARHG